MLLLVILILVGVALICVAVAVLRRRRHVTGVPKMRKAESVGGEREVYERLYGNPRSKTVSVAVPEERPPGGDVDRPWAGLPE
ncbi:MAG TPA: hypothetical protein VHR38_00660 [Solirubrobacterales bacterium]|nr:hypothetical protein [Solirubrobacterales bacterium]